MLAQGINESKGQEDHLHGNAEIERQCAEDEMSEEMRMCCLSEWWLRVKYDGSSFWIWIYIRRCV